MKYLLTLLTFGLLSYSVQAQYNLDVGFKVGGANYLGEIGGLDQDGRGFIYDVRLSETQLSFGGFARYRLISKLGVAAGFNVLKISGTDQNSTIKGRAGRNLSFENRIIEFYTRAEYYFFTTNDLGNRGKYRIDFRSYAFGGLALFSHNPKAEVNGEVRELRPLRTEGQIQEYNRLSFTMPLGLGCYFTFKKRHRIGWDIGYRLTFTDFLDDVSGNYATDEQLGNDPIRIAAANPNSALGSLEDGTYDLDRYAHPTNYGTFENAAGETIAQKRGDASANDSYITTQFHYSIVFRGKSTFYRQKYGWLVGKKKRGRKTRAKF